jgi:hypothetical protein
MATNEATIQQNLRRAILSSQLAGLSEARVLEALLTFVLSRGEAKSVAEDLLARFASLSGVLMADPRKLRQVRGVGDAAAALIKLAGWLRAPATATPPDEHGTSREDEATNGPARSSLPASSRDRGPGNGVVSPEIAASPGRGQRESPHSDLAVRQVLLSGFSPPAEPKSPGTGRRLARAETARRQEVRVIQDLLWKEALMTLEWAEDHGDAGAFQEFIRTNLPQNSLSTRTRYAQTLIRWFYHDGVPGLVGRVWMAYRNQALAEEVLRFRYLEAEPIPAAAVADALFPIQENAVVPDSYLANFVREKFGGDVPEKTIERLKSNLRKLGFLGGAAHQRNVLRPLTPSATGFLVLLHYRFGEPK